MKKTLQDQYLLIKEGKGHKGVFIKEAKRQFPGLIRNAATFTEVANVLKTKNLINENVIGLEPINQLEPSKKESYEVAFENFLAEAKKKKEEDEKAELKKPSKQVEEDAEKNFDYEDKKNPDNLIFDQMMKGYYTEMKDPKNEDKTMEQLKAIVIKNLEKNPIYYTEKGQFGVKDLGYTMDAPGLGEPKEPKGKYKSSGYGNLNENKLLKEALNKDLKDFGSDVKKFLESKGLKVKLGQGDTRSLYDPIGKNDNLSAIQLQNPDLHIIVNDSKIDVLEDIIKRYNLKTLQSLRQTGGWDDDPKKKAQAKGEIYLTKELKRSRKGKTFELVVSRFDPSSVFVPSNNKEPINEEDQIRKVVRSIINEELEDEFYQKQQDLDNMTFDQEKEAHRQAQEYSTEGITQHVNYDGIGYFVSDEFSEDTIATYENGRMINADALKEGYDDRGGRLELDEEPINEKQYTPQQKTDIIDAYGKDKTDENMREIVKLIGSGEIDKDYVVFRLEDKWGYKGGKEQFTTTMKQISLEEAQIREAIRSMINEELEEILQINPVSGGGGRRFIPTNYLLPDSLISKLNLSNPGPNAPAYDESTQIPHIKVFSRDGEAAIYISDLFYVALKGVTRGRSTRAQNVAKATLQKIQDNFTEKDWPAIRALLKKFAYDKLSNIPVKGEIRPYHEIMFPEGYSLKVVDNGVMIDLPPYKPDTLPESKIRKVIKESIEKELAQINKEAEYEVLDSKLEKITDLIDRRKSRLAKLDEDEDIKALTDKKKVKQFEKEIKTLEKAKFKIEKVLAKKAKSAPKKKEMIDEDEPLEEFTKSAEDAKELETTIGNLKPEIEDLKTSIDSLEEDDSLEENNTYGYRYV